MLDFGGVSDDSVLRAITNDGAFRVIVARTTQSAGGVLAAQQAKGVTAKRFGELLTGAVLYRETMAPTLRVQTIIKGAGKSGSLVADSHPSGHTRGLLQGLGEGEIDLGQGAFLQMLRTLPNGRIVQGMVEVPPDGGIGDALMTYMQVSEQVVSMIAVGTELTDGVVTTAGGYRVQLLPEVGRGPLMIMTERLEDFRNIDGLLRDERFSPTWLLEQLLYGMDYTQLEESRLGFECWCDELRLVSALATLGRQDIEELVSSGEVLEITCDYCRKEFRIPPARLRGLLEAS